MSPEEREYFTRLIGGVREEIKQLRKDLAKVNSANTQRLKMKKENSRLVALLDKHGISDVKPKRGRPCNNGRSSNESVGGFTYSEFTRG